MGLRSRLARWLSPEPEQLLERYARVGINPQLLQAWEEARSGGLFERAAPVETTPRGLAGLLTQTKKPSDVQLTAGSLSTSDIASRALANRLSELEPVLKLRRRVTDGTVEEEILDDHVAIERLRDPHPDFTLPQLMALTTKHIVQTGDAYWVKLRNGFGLPAAFQPLPAGCCFPRVNRGVTTEYVYRGPDGGEETFVVQDVMRFWIPDPTTLYTGRGYLAPNWLNHVASIFAEEHLRGFFEHDATPSVYLQGAPGAQAPQNPARTAFEALWIQANHRRKGTGRGAPAWVPPGWEAKESAVQKGSEMVPLLEFWLNLQLKNFGVPRSVLGEVVSGDRSSAETNQYVFDRHTIAPIATLIAEVLTVRYAREFDPRLVIEFDGFIDVDKEFELKREQSDILHKIRSPQQILRDRGSDPEDAPWGEFPPGTTRDTPYTGEEREEPQQAVPFQDTESGETEPPRSARSGWRAKLRRRPAAERLSVLHGA